LLAVVKAWVVVGVGGRVGEVRVAADEAEALDLVFVVRIGLNVRVCGLPSKILALPDRVRCRRSLQRKKL